MRTSEAERWVERAVIVAFAFVVLGVATLYLRYSFGPFIARVNSDVAANILYAREIIGQHTLFPQWNDATGIMSVLTTPNLLFIPIAMAFTSDWFVASRIGIGLDQFGMFALLCWALGRMGMSWAGRLLIVTILVAGPAMTFLMQTVFTAGKAWSYTWLVLLVYLCDALLERHAATPAMRWRIAALLLVGTLVFIDTANAAIAVPALTAALALEWFGNAAAGTRNSCAIAFATLLASCVLAFGLRHTLLAGNHYTPFSVPFTDLVEAGTHFGLFVRGMLHQFGAVPAVGVSPYSMSGALSGVKFLVLVIAVVMPLSLALRRNRAYGRCVRMLAVVCSVSFVVHLYVYLFTGISVDSEGTARYFIAEIMMGLTLGIFWLERNLPERWLCGGLLLAVCLPFVATSPLLTAAAEPPSKAQLLTRMLENSGLHQGYASFWNANAVTALTNGKVFVRAVEFQRGSVTPMRWLSADRWYSSVPDGAESFLLVNNADAKETNLSLLDQMAGAPLRSVEMEGYTALIYPSDFMTHLNWQYTLDHPLPTAAMRAHIDFVSSRIDIANDRLSTRWKLKNLGDQLFSSFGSTPMSLGVHLLGANGEMLNLDLARAAMPPVMPGAEVEANVDVPMAALAGGSVIEADLVQEGVAWFAKYGGQTARMAVPIKSPETNSGGAHVTPIRKESAQPNAASPATRAKTG